MFSDPLLNLSEKNAEISPFYAELFRYLHSQSGAHPLERELLASFPSKEFPLKISRGLPRLYNKEDPSKTRMKEGFSDIKALKESAAIRFIYPLYHLMQPHPGTKITLLNYVIGDGWGDFIAAFEAIRILKKAFPQVEIQWIALVPKHLPIPKDDITPTLSIYYDETCPISNLSSEAMQLLNTSDLILSIPTIYPHIDELLLLLTNRPQTLSIGQYGFLESRPFLPGQKQAYSMGLHFLEHGVMIPDPIPSSHFNRVQNKELLLALFGTKAPNEETIKTYQQSHLFYLAYLLTEKGGAIYLHALLHSVSHSEKDIDLCTPDIGWLISHIESENKKKKSFLEESFGLKQIEIHYAGKIHKRTLGKTGKNLRILCMGPLNDHDFRILSQLSQDFIAIRGDQSFSQAVAFNKIFFYDGAKHARFFMKDLLALAENRIQKHKGALLLFRSMKDAFIQSQPQEGNSAWVDEFFFQETKNWQEIARSIGAALSEKTTKAGFTEFNNIVKQEYAFNRNLCFLVQRALAHRLFPDISVFEKEKVQAFQEGQISLKELVNSVKERLFLKSIGSGAIASIKTPR